MWVIAEISVPSVKRFGGVVCAQRTCATPPLSGCPTCQEAGSDSVNMWALVRLQVQSRVCALRLVQLHQTKCAHPRLNLQPYKRPHVNRIAARFLAGGTTAQRGCRACALCANDTSEAFYGRDADFGDDPHSPLCPFRRGPEDFARVEGDRHGTHTGCHHRTAKAAPLCGAREERRVASHRARHRADSQMSARFIRPGHNRQMGDSAWADRARKDGSTVI